LFPAVYLFSAVSVTPASILKAGGDVTITTLGLNVNLTPVAEVFDTADF